MFDLDAATDDKRWTATPHQKFERLLRETGVHVGLLMNGKSFRLIYAPKGESAGWVTFRLDEILTVDGRCLLGAFHMLLNERRLLSLEPEKRLLGILKASREYQNTVSNALREQVLSSLRELLRGFEHADRIADGKILSDYRREHLQEVYVGLVTALMRMVFILFAEERGLLPMENDLYASSYSLSHLYAQLMEDRGRYGDGLDDRYGAWGRITTLFRLLHDGVKASGGLHLPERRGDFFNPDAFPFLEGRGRGSARQVGVSLTVPRVSDGVVFRVIDLLLVLAGERLQYRGLDVEQIGSVYEGLMGFELQVAVGESLCLKPEHVVVNLEELLWQAGPDRLKTLKANAGLDLKDKSGNEVKAAKSLDELQAALSRRISERQAGRIGKNSLYLQPGDERRKSGSHYTPKSLTSPIVETTLRPVLERLGPNVTPKQLLELKICDPAMGSAAFLVEACRQLADHLVAAWRRTGTMPDFPLDENPELHARRLIAQKCLYGVDKNPLAVDLARLSMWLVTFAKEHPFTFVDHALRSGDSLVGLTREQIAALSLDLSKGSQLGTVRQFVLQPLKRVEALRYEIHAMGDPPDNDRLVELWREATEELDKVRFLGDLVVETFCSTTDNKSRKQALAKLAVDVSVMFAPGKGDAELRDRVATLRNGQLRLSPFHWEIEFPEVFDRDSLTSGGCGTSGFDAFVGNPPWVSYSGKAAQPLHESYRQYFLIQYKAFAGFRNLQSLFVERCARLLRDGGRLGLLIPSSMSEQFGYGPSRVAHDRLCLCDNDLPDYGDSFVGVFQPCMLLRSTRRGTEVDIHKVAQWPVERPDLDACSREIMAKMLQEPLPEDLFSDIGLVTSGNDVQHLANVPDAHHAVPIRSGSDIEAFKRSAPSRYADAAWFGERLRPPTDWIKVRLFVRQTARFPIAALSDGLAFRNTMLAGYDNDEFPAGFLVTYLNSTPIRWLHYVRHRDARQGMPQMKIGHLRSVPMPPSSELVRELKLIGDTLSERNAGVSSEDRTRIDELVGRAFQLTNDELELQVEWAKNCR